MKHKNKNGNQCSEFVKDLPNVTSGLSVKWGDCEIKVDKEDYDALGRAVDEFKSWFGWGKN